MEIVSIVLICLLVLWHEKQIKHLKDELEHTKCMLSDRKVGVENE